MRRVRTRPTPQRVNKTAQTRDAQGGALAAREHAALEVEAVQAHDGGLRDRAVREHSKAVALALAALAVAHELEALQLAKGLEELAAEALVKVVRQAAEEDLRARASGMFKCFFPGDVR